MTSSELVNLCSDQLAHSPDEVGPLRDSVTLKHRPRSVVHVDAHRSAVSWSIRALSEPLGASTLELELSLGGSRLLLGFRPLPLDHRDLGEEFSLPSEEPLHVGDLLLLVLRLALEVNQVLGRVDQVEIDSLLATAFDGSLTLLHLGRRLPWALPTHRWLRTHRC